MALPCVTHASPRAALMMRTLDLRSCVCIQARAPIWVGLVTGSVAVTVLKAVSLPVLFSETSSLLPVFLQKQTVCSPVVLSLGAKLLQNYSKTAFQSGSSFASSFGAVLLPTKDQLGSKLSVSVKNGSKLLDS